MTISFSGLASGLDTSSWVDSLVALKQAKITTLEEEKEEVLLSKETLDNIKSFFTSFRSVIEKVTDARFGVASMDLFAQNIATSANLDVLTASANTEAEEATYDIQVNNLATNSFASSNYSYVTTIIQTTTAASDSKLINLGIKAGNIGVTVNGIEHGITLEEDETIQSFIDKLKEIGVEAGYNEQTGVFSIDIDSGAINDIDNTGIVDALHLEGVNEGYTSNTLQISSTDTVYSAATNATLMSELGAKAGVITVHANDADYRVTITNSTNLGGFINDLKKNNIDASLDSNGVLTINDASIIDEGTTNIVDALGLSRDIYQNSQTSWALSHATIITTSTAATSDTLLKDLGEGINISNGQTVILKNSSNEYTTITVGTGTTLGELLSDMTNAGVYAALNEDGTVEITGGTITGGTFDAVSALGLVSAPYTAMTTGKPLTETIEKFELVTLDTMLVDDLKVRAGYLEVTDADGNTYYEKIYHGQTLGDLMSDLGNLGIYTKLRDDGVLEITGGAFATLSDDRVKQLIANGTIRETDSRYQQGTDLLTCLYGSPVISTNQISVASTYSKSRALTYSVINTINASLTTTLGNLSLKTDGTAIFDVRGEKRTINVNKTMTVDGLMTALKNAGIASSWDSDTSRLTIENAVLSGGSSDLGNVLDLTKTVSGKYVTSNALYHRITVAVGKTTSSSTVLNSTTYVTAGLSTTLAQLGISGNKVVTVHKSDGSSVNLTIASTTTIDSLFDSLDNYGVQGVISDGVITLTSADGAYVTDASGSNLLASLGISAHTSTTTVTTTTGTTQTSGGLTYTEVQTAKVTDKISSFVTVTGNQTITVTDYAGQAEGTVTINANSTFEDMFRALDDLGIQGTMEDGIITLTSGVGNYATGAILTALGISTDATTVTRTVGTSVTGSVKTYLSVRNDVTSYTTTTVITTSTVITVGSSGTATVTITTTVGGTQVVTVPVSTTQITAITSTVRVTTTIETTSTTTAYPAGTTKLVDLGLGIVVGDTIMTNYNNMSVVDSRFYYTVTSESTINDILHTLDTNGAIDTPAFGIYTSCLIKATYENGRFKMEGSIYDSRTSGYHTIEFYGTLPSKLGFSTTTLVVGTGWTPVSLSGVQLSQTIKTIHGTTTSVTTTETTGYITTTINTTTTFTITPGNVQIIPVTTNVTKVVTATVATTVTTPVTTVTTTTVTTTSVVPGGSTLIPTKTTKLSEYGNGSILVSIFGDAYYYTPNNATTIGDFQTWLQDKINDTLLSIGEKAATATVKDSYDSNGKIYFEVMISNMYSTMGNIVIGIPSTSSFVDIGLNGNYGSYTTKYETLLAKDQTLASLMGGDASATYAAVGIIYNSDGSIQSTHNYNFMGSYTMADVARGLSSSATSESRYGYTLSASLSDSGDLYVEFDSNDGSYVVLSGPVANKLSINKTYTNGQFSHTLLNNKVTQLYDFYAGPIKFNSIVTSTTSIRTITTEYTSTTTTQATSTSSTVVTKTITVAATGTATISVTPTGTATITVNTSGVSTITMQATVPISYTTITPTTLTVSMTHDSTLAQLGLTATGQYIKGVHEGGAFSIGLSKTNTIGDIAAALAGYGVSAIVKDGKLTLAGTNDGYITDISASLKTALGITNVGQNYTYATRNETTYSNTLSNTQRRTVTLAANGSTTMAQTGHTGTIKVNYEGKLYTVTATGSKTIGDVLAELAGYGISGSINNGTVKLTGTSDGFITDAGGAFGLTGAAYTTSTSTTVTGYNTNSNQQGYNTTKSITTESSLSSMGLAANGTITINQAGTLHTVTVKTTDTIDNMFTQLAAFNIQGSLNNGTLTLQCTDDAFVSGISTNLNNILKLSVGEGNSYVTTTYQEQTTLDTRLNQLTDASGNSLGITSGSIYVYQDGTRYLVNINNTDTLQTLASKLSQYGISMELDSNGKLYFEGNNNSYLTTQGITSGASNILTKLNIADNWSTRYDSTSDNLKYTEKVNDTVTGSTLLSELQDSSGNNLGITTGSFYVYNSGVRTTETITADMTVNDLMSVLAKNGLIADISEDGSISVGAYNNSYLATSAVAGANSNIVSTLFSEWNFVNIYTSNNLTIPTDVIQAMSRDTKLANINEGTYQEGYITVVKDGIKTNIELNADETAGSLIDKLALYGFEAVISENGQIILKNTGDSLLQNYTGSAQESNALQLLGIELNSWIQTNTYKSNTLNVITTSTLDADVTRDTKLSLLGVTTGEYNIYKDGVKYTAYISSGDTMGQFLDTLKSFGIETSIVSNGNSSILTITGNGDTYISKSTSTTDSSNVVEKLFGNNNHTSSYNYKGLEQTSSLRTTFTAATEDTVLNELNKEWGENIEGDLSVNVNGVTNTLKIQADETVGSLLEKFRTLGLEASISSTGQIMIQSGFNTFTINPANSTSSLANPAAKTGLTYHDDLGGFAASADVTEATTTKIEERTLSSANYADYTTKMGLLNISDGTLSIYKNGQKASIQIKKDETFADLRSRISAAFSDIDLVFEDGYLKIYSKNPNDSIEVGATTDTSNFSAITGITSDGTTVTSARELFCVNSESVITNSGLFRRGNITEGTFIIGDATFNITNTTTMANLISQINATDEANATAYWDSIDGKLVIKSRTTGAALINIEAGTSNFTDIMGYTSTSTETDGTKVSRMNIQTQEIGKNAKFSINGTSYTSNSNTITSDVSRIKGLTINLKGLTDGSAVTLTVERDKETLANAISDVVDAYNELMTNVDEAIAKDGQLHDQSVLKLVRNQLRNMMTSSDAGTTIFRNLDAIGIKVDAASANNIATNNITNLTFDKDKFFNAFEADQDAVKALLIGSDNNTGVFTKVENLLESSLKAVTGYFDTADASYTKQTNRLEAKIQKQQKALEKYRAQLEAKFASMDMLIANMQQQYSTFLNT